VTAGTGGRQTDLVASSLDVRAEPADAGSAAHPRPGVRLLGGGLGTLVLAEVVAAGWLAAAVGMSARGALDAFVVTNGLMAASAAVCGLIIAWHRPSNPIGWLFLGYGLGHATTALGVPLGVALVEDGAAGRLVRSVATVAAWSWPWSIGLFLPLALLLFPDGRLPSPRWRAAAIAVVVTAPLFVVEAGTAPERVDPALPVGYLTLPSYGALAPLWTLSEVRTLLAFGLAITGLIIRYRRGGEELRRQLLWLLLATITAAAGIVPWALVAGTPILVLFAIPLIPAAVTVAILRHRLLDIRLVVARAVAWLLLSTAVAGGYAILVALLDKAVSARLGRSATVTVLVALLLALALPPLQRLVDRAMYGDRRDVARVVSQVGRRLTTGQQADLSGVPGTVRAALRLPYVAVRTPAGPLAADGDPAGQVLRAVPLHYAGEVVGEIVLGLRPGEREIATRDRDVLTLVAAPLAVAVHATGLSADLQSSRGRIVAAREEERRRLRRDLHDDLGPALTGVALAADAAANLIDDDPAATRELLGSMRSDVRSAIAGVRRLVDDLRPPALDEFGLVEALRHRTEQAARRADGASVRVSLHLDGPLPALPAGIEVAAYRIAAEALTNVVRHSRATAAAVRLRCADNLEIEVLDDGPPAGDRWQPGIGLRAMRERADELGGRFEAGPSADGGRVFASLPLVQP
jgi:two-component system NarL family sensor kinase